MNSALEMSSRSVSQEQTILIVDDNPNNLGVIVDYLETYGYMILVAQDGESALERVHFGQPGLILLDVMMPGIDGFETCRRLKADERTRHIPVIFMTALTDLQEKIKGFQVGAVDYITKPLQQEEVLARVNTHLRLSNLTHELQQLNVELESAIKEIGAFTYSIAHDLQAPIRAITSFSNILQKDHGPELSIEASGYIDKIKDNSQQLRQLTDDLLTFSEFGHQALKAEPVDPVELVGQVLKDLTPEQRNRQVEIIVDPLPPCQADPTLLRQVFFCLLDNALKYSRRRETAYIKVGCQQKEGQPIYFVRDNGVGFDMRFAGKLFGVFQRLHLADEYEGTGVGLAIVQRIIHRHGGKVWAEAEVDKGATLYFTI